MKQFLRIYCLYLVILSCIPCNDGEHGHDAATGSGETTMLAEHQDSPTHEHCADFCSPLCTCACCGCVTNSVKVVELQFSQHELNIGASIFTYKSPSSYAHFAALFRPPINKLG